MVRPTLVVKVKHIDRVVSGCLFQGYPVIFKIKIPSVPRVFEKNNREVGENLMNFQKRKKKDSSVFKCMDILIHANYVGWIV